MLSVVLVSIASINMAHADYQDRYACKMAVLNSSKQQAADLYKVAAEKRKAKDLDGANEAFAEAIQAQDLGTKLEELMTLDLTKNNDKALKPIVETFNKTWADEIKTERENVIKMDRFSEMGQSSESITNGIIFKHLSQVIQYHNYKAENTDVLGIGGADVFNGNREDYTHVLLTAELLQDMSADECKKEFTAERLGSLSTLNGFGNLMNDVAQNRFAYANDKVRDARAIKDAAAKKIADAKAAKDKSNTATALKLAAAGELKPENKHKIEVCETGFLKGSPVKTLYDAMVKTYQYKGTTVQDTTWLNGSRPAWSKSRVVD